MSFRAILIVILSEVQRSRKDLIDSTAVILEALFEGPHYKHRLFAKHTDRHSCLNVIPRVDVSTTVDMTITRMRCLHFGRHDDNKDEMSPLRST